MEENNVKKTDLSKIETSQLKELFRAERIIDNALVMYASILNSVGGCHDAVLATNLAAPHSQACNEIMKELSSRKTLDEQSLS